MPVSPVNTLMSLMRIVFKPNNINNNHQCSSSSHNQNIFFKFFRFFSAHLFRSLGFFAFFLFFFPSLIQLFSQFYLSFNLKYLPSFTLFNANTIKIYFAYLKPSLPPPPSSLSSIQHLSKYHRINQFCSNNRGICKKKNLLNVCVWIALLPHH